MKNWRPFLEKLSQKLFAEADDFELETIAEDEPERMTSRWLGFAGAAPDAIEVREKALGTRLPADYRAFLQASNGFRGLAGLPHGICSLLPVEKIGWMRDVDRSGRLVTYLENRKRGAALPEAFVVDPDAYARTLLVGESDGNECILLLPPEGQGAWEVWTYDPEAGFETVETFTELMESALEA